MTSAPVPIVIFCQNCSRCYPSGLREDFESDCPHCHRRVLIARSPKAPTVIPQGLWMMQEESACDVVLVELDRTRIDEGMQSLHLYSEITPSLLPRWIEQLPAVICRDLTLRRAESIRSSLAAAGVQTELRYQRYSALCSLKLVSVSPITADLIKALLAARGGSVMETRYLLSMCPQFLITEMELKPAQRLQKQLELLGAVVLLIHNIYL